MQEIIRGIISAIPCGCVFDSHYVISTLIQKNSEAYTTFVDELVVSRNGELLNVHGALEELIVQCKDLTQRVGDESWSLDVHQDAGKCTAWRRIR